MEGVSEELLRFSFMSHGPILNEDGAFVLAADAEAHEKAAVERAIRDCIAAVDDYFERGETSPAQLMDDLHAILGN